MKRIQSNQYLLTSELVHGYHSRDYGEDTEHSETAEKLNENFILSITLDNAIRVTIESQIEDYSLPSTKLTKSVDSIGKSFLKTSEFHMNINELIKEQEDEWRQNYERVKGLVRNY